MADRLTAAQLAQLTGPTIVPRPRYSITIDGVDFGAYLVSVGSVKWRVANRHPRRSEGLAVPVLEVTLDNTSGLFRIGHPDGPWLTDEERIASVVRVTCTICSPAIVVNDFTGGAEEPSYSDSGEVRLGILHPLSMAEQRVWQREDQTSDWDTTTTTTRDATP